MFSIYLRNGDEYKIHGVIGEPDMESPDSMNIHYEDGEIIEIDMDEDED